MNRSLVTLGIAVIILSGNLMALAFNNIHNASYTEELVRKIETLQMQCNEKNK